MTEIGAGETAPAGVIRDRAALQAAKLDALVGTQWGPDPSRQRQSFGAGAGLTAHSPGSASAVDAWVYPLDRDLAVLGAALVWSNRQGAKRLQLLVDDDQPDGMAGALARRAAYFDEPEVTVWAVTAASGRAGLRPVEAVPLPAVVTPPAAPELVDLLLDAGAEIVVEGGMVRAEVNGLEVARIVPGDRSTGEPAGEPRLEVGVGAADREMTEVMHREMAPADRLARAVEAVRRYRTGQAPRHPLNQLVPERWLRAVAVRDPDVVGLAELRPVGTAYPRQDLTRRALAAAEGTTRQGRPVVATFSAGVDVDLVPAAADARAFVRPEAELWLVLPERDCYAATRRLAEQLLEPALVVPVPNDWRSLA